MEKKKNKRFQQSMKAYNMCLKENLEETKLQEAFTKKIENFIQKEMDNHYEKNPDGPHLTNMIHSHICAFKLLSNDKKWCAAQCKKEQKKLPKSPFDDYCDICPKMTYIAFDNHLNVMFASRTFTEETLKYFDLKK